MILPVTLSGLPDGIPGICPLKFGFRTTRKFLFGAYDCIMYGPVDGMPFVDWSLAGVFAGTKAANSVARMLSMSPSGCTSLIAIVPAASFVVIPVMWPFFVLPYWSAPWIAEKKPTPGESIL